tara:strand:- start:233 stop:628 length:396 start_codon:yes stop_codon:yes gene_type:complete
MIINITNVATGNNISSANTVAIYATTANGQVFCFDDLCPTAKAPAFVEKVSGYGVINTSCWTKVRNANGSRPKALGSRPAKAARAPQPRVAVKAAPAATEVAKLKKQLAAVTIRARKAEAQLYALTGKAAA